MYFLSLGFFSFSVLWRKSWRAWRKFSPELQSCLIRAGILVSTGSGKCSWSVCFQAVMCCPWSTISNIILVDLYSTFVLGIVALQLVDFRQCLVVIPRLHHLVERWMFVYGSHRVTLVTLCGQVFYCACFSCSLWCCTFDLLWWIYHLPHDIAVITVCYHTEMNKLKLKLKWLSLEIMVSSFK